MMTSLSTETALACAIALSVACAKSTPLPQTAHPEASQELAQEPTSQRGRAQELIVAADLELRDLDDIQAVTTSEERRQAVVAQMVAVRHWRDRVQADLAGRDAERLSADTSNLERALQAGAATQPQGPTPVVPDYEVEPSGPALGPNP